MKTRKPRVITKCVANCYTDDNERIIEFSNGDRSVEGLKGGLIAFRNLPDGTLLVNVYRCDEGVDVRVERPDDIEATLDTIAKLAVINQDPAIVLPMIGEKAMRALDKLHGKGDAA